jgi:pimeloyl-ACP methyl ester carboxylesterase
VQIGTLVVIAVTGFVGMVVVSYAIETLRPQSISPVGLAWAPGVPVEYANLEGIRVRYIKVGSGPALVLLHTLRTQLDLFQRIVPELSRHFTVYAYDYPGHGWSDIARANYEPEDFYRWTAAYLNVIDVQHATLVGISIGGTIALVLAARQNPRVARVVSINAYDDLPDGSIRRSSVMARLILGPSDIPILGPTLMRLRNRYVTDQIMDGGVVSTDALPPDLKKEFYEVGSRRGHYQGFLSLLAHERQWSEACAEYARIRIPTLLIYGDRDWAPPATRERDLALIPGASIAILDRGGHFLSLDQPRALSDLIIRFDNIPRSSEVPS